MAETPPPSASAQDAPEPPDEAVSTLQATDGRRARSEQRRQQRRLAILESARDVFGRKGYHTASVHDIIDHSGIARGTFYLYFSSKEDVFADLVAAFLQDIRAQVRKVLLGPSHPTPAQQIRDNVRRVVATVLAHREVASIILRDATGLNPESHAQVDAFFARIGQLIEDALTVGERLGIVRPCALPLISATVIGGLRAVLLRVLEARDTDAASVFAQTDTVSDELLALFLEGLAPRKTAIDKG